MSQPEHVKDPSVEFVKSRLLGPSSKRVGVVFFALRLSYRFSDLIVRMGSFLQLIPDFHFLFELLNLTSAIKHLENSLRQSFVHSTPKPDTQASAIYIENISLNELYRRIFNVFRL
jgi:hypothetical protein